MAILSKGTSERDTEAVVGVLFYERFEQVFELAIDSSTNSREINVLSVSQCVLRDRFFLFVSGLRSAARRTNEPIDPLLDPVIIVLVDPLSQCRFNLTSEMTVDTATSLANIIAKRVPLTGGNLPVEFYPIGCHWNYPEKPTSPYWEVSSKTTTTTIP